MAHTFILNCFLYFPNLWSIYISGMSVTMFKYCGVCSAMYVKNIMVRRNWKETWHKHTVSRVVANE